MTLARTVCTLFALLCLLPAGAAVAEDTATRATASDVQLQDLDGDTVSLSDFRGKVVVVAFWATWCKPCLQELPHLQALADAHPDDLVILAISTDGPETRSSVRQTVRRKKWTMPILLDDSGEATAALNPRAANPYTVFVDRNGKIASEHEGYAPGDEEHHKELVEKLIGEAAE